MSDLRNLHRTLVGTGLVPTPPYDAVVGRARSIRRRQSLVAVAGVALLMVLVASSLRSVGLEDAGSDRTRVGSMGTTSTSDASAGTAPPSGDADAPPTTASPDGTPGTSAPGDPDRRTSPPPTFQCRSGANGGAMGKGVTADRIHLLGAAQLDGPTKTLVEDVPLAWKAVIDRVNRGGGICGRMVQVSIVNRLFERDRDLGAEEVVGMLLGPLDPDIGNRLRDGNVDRWGVPMVGGDGGRTHFSSSWLWPVDLPTAAFARIGVEEAYRTGARSFAVVYDPEIAPDASSAVTGYVGTLAGAEVRGAVALNSQDPAYPSQAHELSSACGPADCDAVVLALLPETAKKWLQTGGPLGTRRAVASSTLFTEGFGQDCARQTGADCKFVRVWTGVTPPIESFVADPDVARYVDDMGERNALNPWTQSAYLAAQVMVAALQHAGPRVDRASLRAALDELQYRSGLVSQLDWGPRVPEERVGNTSARAVRLEVTAGAFRGFRDADTGWVRDPWPGRFPD